MCCHWSRDDLTIKCDFTLYPDLQVSEAPFQEEVRPMGETGHSGTRRRKRYSSCVLRNDESSANASPVLSGSDVDSELSAEGSLYNSMKRIYQKYCEEAEAKSDMKLVKLTWDEYFTQQSIDDDEFNPEDTLESILSEIEDSPWPKEIKESMFRQMAHRFRR
ncbi:hypothetical protein KC19_VG310600 [Ceratodon purpureus]|uniref:Uncharacterized protein n=1 Tax=Ceratodon purpureus TaxID=3225 RepID=A0A8T0HWB8_CERPU|nr:hypothetical protein KC19_VG310600 [Ceratodon purpureus]